MTQIIEEKQSSDGDMSHSEKRSVAVCRLDRGQSLDLEDRTDRWS